MPTQIPYKNLVDVVRHHAETRPDSVVYRFLADGELERERITFRELYDRCSAFASHVSRLASPGDRALLVFPSGTEFIIAFIGCLFAEIVPVPVHAPRDPRQLERFRSVVRDASPKLALSSGVTYAQTSRFCRSDAELASLAFVATDAFPEAVDAAFAPREIASDALAFLQYTSGSTGAPKGVMVTHGNLLANEECIKRAMGHDERTIFAGWLPLFHDMGLIGNVLQPLYLGISSVLMSPVAFLQKPLRWLSAVSRYGVTTTGAPNFAYELCVRKVPEAKREGLDLSRWSVAYNGAEPVRADTLERFAEAYAPHGLRREALYPCYGMAEATLFIAGGWAGSRYRVDHVDAGDLALGVATPVPDDATTARALVSCGRTVCDDELVIVCPDTREALPGGRVGEIWLRGTSVAAGYFRNPEQTDETFRARLADGRGPFLRTGDLGFQSEGELYVTGRLKDVIIIRGRNHYPQDIEATVGSSHPAFVGGGGAAFAVDDGREERLVVVHESTVDDPRSPEADEALRAAREAVSTVHQLFLSDLVLLPPRRIPKTSSGKIQRRACRARYLEDLASRPRGAAAVAGEMP